SHRRVRRRARERRPRPAPRVVSAALVPSHRLSGGFSMSLVSRGLAVAALALASLAAQSQTLRVGLAEDPDVLDPTLARTFVGRIVFAALCDKLFDIDEKLQIVPQLATGYEWSADSKTLTI